MMQHNKLEILHLTKRFGEKTLYRGERGYI